MMYYIEQLLTGVGVKDTDACLRWAFGDEYMSMKVHVLDDAWNERHEDLFVLCGSDSIEEGTERIGRTYVKEVQDDNGRGKE